MLHLLKHLRWICWVCVWVPCLNLCASADEVLGDGGLKRDSGLWGLGRQEARGTEELGALGRQGARVLEELGRSEHPLQPLRALWPLQPL